MSYFIGYKNTENNDIFISYKPLTTFIESKRIYGLINEYDFKIRIYEKNKYKFFISRYRCVNSILFYFEIDIYSILNKLFIENDKYNLLEYYNNIPYSSNTFINFPYKSLIHEIFEYKLPYEIIEIILKHLKIKINYRFTISYINQTYLTQPKINIPSIFLTNSL